MNKTEVNELLLNTLKNDMHVVGAVIGSGMMAKYAARGGTDIFLALSAGKYRLRGRGSICSYLPIGNSNELVMDFGTKELLPILKNNPVIFGLNCSDPTIHLYEYIKKIQNNGFSGIVNFPTMTLIDGMYRENLEAHNNSFNNEVEAIKFASYCGLYTIGFITTIKEAKAMLEAGCDCICVHLGFTKGGSLGVSQCISLAKAKVKAEEIFEYINKVNKKVIKVVYGGPITTFVDMEYMYKDSLCDGFFGGSTFDRIPVEKVVLKTIKNFKKSNIEDNDNDLLIKLIKHDYKTEDFVDFSKAYVSKHYSERVLLSDIALLIHVTPSYLSNLFSKSEKMSFTQYLLKYRLNKSKDLLVENSKIKDVALEVGYIDSMQFSKMFKKHIGISPSEFKNNNI